MSWGLGWMTWFGGGGWEERNLKGRLEPGTSVANGSMFDNIRRGWWWGGEREAGLFPGSATDLLLSSTSRPATKRLRASREK